MSIVRRTTEETRQCILLAAWDHFRQLGFRKTTIADIAGTLGMSSANIYRFFPSKDALTEAICRNVLGAMIAAAQTAASGSGGAVERLRAVLMILHCNLRDQMTNQQRVHEVVATAMEENWASIREFLESCDAIAAALIEEGQAIGAFGPGDPATLGRMTMAACAAIHHPTLIAQCGEMNPDMRPDALVDFTIRALANKNPPAESQRSE